MRNKVVTPIKQLEELKTTSDEVLRDKEVYDDAHAHNELVYYCYLGGGKCEAEDRTVMLQDEKRAFIKNMKGSLDQELIDWWTAKENATMLHLWFRYQKSIGADGIAFMPNRNSPEEIEEVMQIALECGFNHIANGMDVNTPDMPYTYYDYSNRTGFVKESLYIVAHENEMRDKETSVVSKQTVAPKDEKSSPITFEEMKKRFMWMPLISFGGVNYFNKTKGLHYTVEELASDSNKQFEVIQFIQDEFRLDVVFTMMDLSSWSEAVYEANKGIGVLPIRSIFTDTHVDQVGALFGDGFEFTMENIAKLEVPDPYRDGRRNVFFETMSKLKKKYGSSVAKIGYVVGPFTLATRLRNNSSEIVLDVKYEEETFISIRQ